MRPLLDRLRAGQVVVGDGAWGTMLMAHGLPPGDGPERLNLSRPAVLETIARLYLDAGAEIITTNTFGGSPARLRLYGLDSQVDAVNRAAVEALRRAVGTRAYVSGSMGPTGHLLAPYGDMDPAEAAEGFARQARALASAGVDLFCVETMTDLGEARLAVAAARAAAPDVPVIATMTFDRTRRGFYTVMGNSVEQAIRGLTDAGADIVGSNCGNGSETMAEVARAFRAAAPAAFLAIQSNAGLPETRGSELVYPEDPERFAASVPALVDAGVQVIGGCCGTTPDHIRALRRAIEEVRS